MAEKKNSSFWMIVGAIVVAGIIAGLVSEFVVEPLLNKVRK
jgi:uncharacterized protein YybS (DUF2232 family)